jgi:hypothetical protein
MFMFVFSKAFTSAALKQVNESAAAEQLWQE